MAREVTVIGYYLRVSSDHQETRSQKAAILKWCVDCGYPYAELIEYKDHAISGATMDRPGLQAMLRDVRAGKLTRIITFELSRISRDFLDTLNVMKLLADHNVIVETPGEGRQAFDSVMEQFIVAAKGLVSSQERENIRRRIKAGLAAAKGRGQTLGAPAGNQRRKGKVKEHDPELIKRMLRLRKKLTLREIAVETGLSLASVSRLIQRYG